MAYSFLLLVSRTSLPDVAELGSILRNANLPLEIKERWNWKKDSGWLPMLWRNVDSGCEIELSKLSKKEAAVAKKAGHAGFDTAITITTRGWESLQCGVCFGAALAVATSGCISEGEDEYIAHDAAMQWARESIIAANEQAQLDKERDAAMTEAQPSGNIASNFEAALASLSGSEVRVLFMPMNHLAVVLKDGRRISGSAWRVVAKDGTERTTNRYASIRTRQARLMSRADDAKIEKELAALDEQLEEAAALDANDASCAINEINTWPDIIRIKSVNWIRPNTMEVTFDAGPVITFVGGLFGEVTCSLPPLRYGITDEGPRLV